jgi:hypothetical protein
VDSGVLFSEPARIGSALGQKHPAQQCFARRTAAEHGDTIKPEKATIYIRNCAAVNLLNSGSLTKFRMLE